MKADVANAKTLLNSTHTTAMKKRDSMKINSMDIGPFDNDTIKTNKEFSGFAHGRNST